MATNNSSFFDAYNLDLILDMTYAASYVLTMLPVSFCILFLGFQRWRRRQAITNSDFFTYNLAAMELIGVAGYAADLFYIVSHSCARVAAVAKKFPWFGQMLFPIFACVEHYMAVVHPVAYLRLKRGRGLWVGYVSSSAVWIFACASTKANLDPSTFLILDMGSGILYVCATAFCCFSSLRVLSRAKPGEGGRARAERSKRNAFLAIVVIMVVLVHKFAWNILFSVFCYLTHTSHVKSERCRRTGHLVNWLNLVSNLMLPAMFLHRRGRLPRCK